MKMRGRLSSRATVQGDIYRTGGGGGSSVEPNPTGEIVGLLETIGIDGDIYKIGDKKIDILYNNTSGAPTGTYLPLAHNFRDYDLIYMKVSNPIDIANFNIYVHVSFMPYMVSDGEKVSIQALYSQRVVDVIFNASTFNVIRVDGDYRNTVYEIVGVKL